MGWRALAGWVGAALGLGIGLGTGGGCLACDEGVCSSILWVYAREPGRGPLQDGEYIVEIEVDDEPSSATCTVSEGGHAIDCAGLEHVLYAPLYDSDDNPHTVLELFFEGAPPEHVEVRISHDGAVVLDEAFDPDYARAEPARCDSDCEHATHDFELSR